MARILVVDDSAVARKALGNLITALGHTVAGEAANGRHAFVEYSVLKPDVVTMDWSMEGKDGAQAITEIIAAFPDAQILVISARQETGIIKEALARGAKHFIIKPVSREKLAAALADVLQESSPCEAQELGSISSSARVLIVDDSGVARKSLGKIITSLGHTVVGEANSGAQAFVEYIRLKPDIVTMDLTMQGLGGAEAISKIIAADPTARIIVVSAMEARQGIIDALERGARHFIVKPIQSDKVTAALNNVLQQEFDLKQHVERVRKLKDAETAGLLADGFTAKIVPPYIINIQDSNFVHVIINQSLTEVSYESLLVELEEHLENSPRVLLDFGMTANLDAKLLGKLNELVDHIVKNAGVVRAISNNSRFVENFAEPQNEASVNLLAEILRYYEG